jgi:hypothetical protein
LNRKGQLRLFFYPTLRFGILLNVQLDYSEMYVRISSRRPCIACIICDFTQKLFMQGIKVNINYFGQRRLFWLLCPVFYVFVSIAKSLKSRK